MSESKAVAFGVQTAPVEAPETGRVREQNTDELRLGLVLGALTKLKEDRQAITIPEPITEVGLLQLLQEQGHHVKLSPVIKTNAPRRTHTDKYIRKKANPEYMIGYNRAKRMHRRQLKGYQKFSSAMRPETHTDLAYVTPQGAHSDPVIPRLGRSLVLATITGAQVDEIITRYNLQV